MLRRLQFLGVTKCEFQRDYREAFLNVHVLEPKFKILNILDAFTVEQG